MVEIPHPKTLDPYGYARENELNIEQTPRRYLLRENVKAKIVPWEDAGILYYIGENKKKWSEGREENKKNTQSRFGQAKESWCVMINSRMKYLTDQNVIYEQH